MKVGAVVLAAGESRRMRLPRSLRSLAMTDRKNLAMTLKQCLPLGETKSGQVTRPTLLGKVVQTVLHSAVDKVVLVVGHEAKEVISCIGSIADESKLQIVVNRQYKSGLSSSLIKGIRAIGSGVDAAIFILGDQPNISVELINELIQEYRNSGAPLCVPFCDGERGNPVLLGKEFFAAIFKLRGDVGARELVEKNLDKARKVIVTDKLTQFDVNTWEDYQKLRGEILRKLRMT